MKYRIAVQEIEGNNFRHVHNIMFESEDLKSSIKKIRDSIKPEIEERVRLFNEWKHMSIVKEMAGSEEIDWEAKGNDISKETREKVMMYCSGLYFLLHV